MRPVPLTTLKGGINRLRVKGGTSTQLLYDCVNGWIAQDGSIQQREGTTRTATLDGTTKGLMADDGIFNVFATSLQTVPSGYLCNLLIHPTDSTQNIKTIWFAKPFLGFPYVVAEFTNGDVFHYWLQSSGVWTANNVYTTGSIVTPVTPNGLAYIAVRNVPANSTWSPQTTVALNQIVEPTSYTGYMYKAIAVAGATPHTGDTEPVWPIVTNATIQEFGDFDQSSSDSGTSGGDSDPNSPLSSSITDRYGDSTEISGDTGSGDTSTADVPTASTAVTTWAPGTTYAPGSVVQPSTSQGAFINAIPNGDFENGNDGNWVLSAGAAYSTTIQYQGTYCISLTANNSTATATMNTFGVVTPGQSVTANAYFNPHSTGADMGMSIGLRWYTSADVFISQVNGPTQENGGYRKSSVTGNAPATAARVRVVLSGGNGTSHTRTGYVDLVDWSLETPAAVSNFLYEAIQAAAASSATTEPTWPTVAGNTVIDGGVTWKAIGTSIITWEALPILLSGSTEPTWPTVVGTSVYDGNMSWEATSRQITDTKCPNSKAVALAASHVFAGDKDIVPYSAAVDPTDWTSTNNAGYLPTGLNNYGDNPVAMLTLYRSNLCAFNAGGYQMWQVDPDPANMALLDAQPVGSIYTRAAQSVANDLLFLTEVGVRNLGTVGAAANMQIGGLGQPIDPIVKAALNAGTYDPISLYYPGRGQYWLIFGPQAFVLTVNGVGLKSWTRFIFPASITDWCLMNGDLYLRTDTNLVWMFDDSQINDDCGTGGTNTPFTGIVQWPYLDLGVMGINKMLQGYDMIGDGAVTIQFGFDQRDPTTFSDNAGFSTSLNVTPPYVLNACDTEPGNPIPFVLNAPTVTLILTFAGNQEWQWEASNLYVTDQRGGGATG